MSMTTKHTPGPWTIDPRYVNEPVQEVYGPDCVVGDARAGFVPQNDRERKLAGEVAHANARLIAAAPELLEALRELAALVDAIRSGDYQPDSFTTQPARAAIARAEGR